MLVGIETDRIEVFDGKKWVRLSAEESAAIIARWEKYAPIAWTKSSQR